MDQTKPPQPRKTPLFTLLRRGMLTPEPTPVETDRKVGYWVRFSRVPWTSQFYSDGNWYIKTGVNHAVRVMDRITIHDFREDTAVFLETL